MPKPIKVELRRGVVFRETSVDTFCRRSRFHSSVDKDAVVYEYKFIKNGKVKEVWIIHGCCQVHIMKTFVMLWAMFKCENKGRQGEVSFTFTYRRIKDPALL